MSIINNDVGSHSYDVRNTIFTPFTYICTADVGRGYWVARDILVTSSIQVVYLVYFVVFTQGTRSLGVYIYIYYIINMIIDCS